MEIHSFVDDSHETGVKTNQPTNQPMQFTHFVMPTEQQSYDDRESE